MKVITTIDNEQVLLDDAGIIHFRAKAAIDTDGSGPLHGDPYAQRDTSFHYKGAPLNADEDYYIVVPPILILAVPGIVLGCQAHCINLANRRHTDAVVGDVGPRRKLGEMSVACARALGIPDSPTTGGTNDHIVLYSFQPGVPAVVGSKTYSLQRHQ